MAYKFSKGSQTIGDLRSVEDAQRNTLIDFGEDQIDFQTSGSVRLQITNDGVEALNGNFKGTLSGTASNAAMDTMGANLVGGVFEIDQGVFQNPNSSYNPIYFPSDDSFNERVGPNSANYFIAPFNGEVVKIQIRSLTDFSTKSLTASLHLGVDGDNAYSSTPAASVAVAGQNSHNVHTFDFMGVPSASFTEGDIFGFSLELEGGYAGTETIQFTTIVKYDPYA